MGVPNEDTPKKCLLIECEFRYAALKYSASFFASS